MCRALDDLQEARRQLSEESGKSKGASDEVKQYKTEASLYRSRLEEAKKQLEEVLC